MPDQNALCVSLKQADSIQTHARRPPTSSAQPLLEFHGPAHMPFLAPRGVCLTNHMLLVSDTGRNRVFIWHDLPQTPHATPDVVIGQPDDTHSARNQGDGHASASSLQYPSGLWSDGQRLVVADAWNHRVLIWHQLPTQHHQPADVVLGQPDFDSNQPNMSGVGATPDAHTLYWPYGVHSDGQRLWIADTGNRRVLYFDRIPVQHCSPADGVIGQADFRARDYDPLHATWPYSVKISPQGALAIADPQYYRILVWPHWQSAFRQQADWLIGQPNFQANGMNQYGLAPQAHTLSWCYDACFTSDERLLAADTGNSRILVFDPVPAASNAPATGLIGQADFCANGEQALKAPHQLYWPFAVCAYGERLAVADTGNHRILLYKLT